ncbi:MAG TPA: TrbC/VirB2 family protein [Allosphingosinicella sp.]|nr:TrbC/VirB2 family protein [Allosphingosinicella sp.]
MLAGPALTYLASTSASLADPAGSSVLVAAVSWLQQTLLGTVATTIAVIAVASVGFSMLNGRVSVRYGMTVVIGCFILLGASSIAAGIQSFVGGGDGGSYAPEPPPPAVLPPAPPPTPPAPANNDPYAGASVPSR